MRDDGGSILAVFGGRVTTAGLAGAFASLPVNAWVPDTITTWYSGKKDCEGQDDPDEDRDYPVVCVLLIPRSCPPGRPQCG